MNTTQHQMDRPVVFRDQSAEIKYLTRSNRPTSLSTTWEDGKIYPVIEMDLSSAAYRARRRHHGAGASRRSGRSRRRQTAAAHA